MIRKLLCGFILAAGTAILLLAMDQTFINKLRYERYLDHLRPAGSAGHSRYHQLFIRSDRWRFGDLYGLSYLPGYKFRLEPFMTYNHPRGRLGTNKVLYIIGDSYLADKSLSGAFDQFDDVVFLDRRFPFGPIVLDSTKQNYLVMEFAERNLNDFTLKNTAETLWRPAEIASGLNFRPLAAGAAGPAPAGMPERVGKVIFNPDLSRNLELVLFDDSVFSPVKELKAWINYKFFGRTAREVVVSTDKSRLLLSLTVDTTYRTSGFRNIGGGELQTLINSLDYANKYYRAIGFKKVALSVIPNAVSLYDDRRMRYNHLLQRVEQNNKFPVISVFQTDKNTPYNLNYRSDAHWNPQGLDLWVKQVNKFSINW